MPLEPSLDNLFDHCLRLRSGQRLVVVVEPEGENFYRDDLGALVAQAARLRGAEVHVMAPSLVRGPEDFPTEVWSAIAAADHTLFFSRLGIQARFLPLPGPGTKVVSYALDTGAFASRFGSLPYGYVEALRTRVIDRILGARRYRLRCPRGTDLAMDLAGPALSQEPVLTPFTVRNFPSMIFPPVTASGLSGTLALSLALQSTSVHDYPNPILPLDSPLLLEIDRGRIVGFGGDPAQARRARDHLHRVADLVGGDPGTVNSWHTGIHPATAFPGPALADLDRWGSVVFGSPRYTHFHLVGHDPGEVCGSLFDATIEFDGQALWDQGRFAFLEFPENRDLAAEFGVDPSDLRGPYPVGF